MAALEGRSLAAQHPDSRRGGVRSWLCSFPPSCAAPASASKPAISPAPGTPDASPQTQISILGVRPSRIASVRVTGAQQRRAPRAPAPLLPPPRRELRAGAAARAGRAVRVVVRIRGRAPLRSSFTVAHLGPVQPALTAHRQPAGQAASTSSQSPRCSRRRITTSSAPRACAATSSSRRCPSPVVHPGATTPSRSRRWAPAGR